MNGTRTDELIALVTEELRARRAEIDALLAPRSMTLQVMCDERTGHPYRVLWRTEGLRDLAKR